MKTFLFVGLLFLTACSNSQLAGINTALDQYDQAINNFNTAAARINTSIALTSTTVAGYCQDAKVAGTNLTSVVSGNQKVLTALNTITAGLNTYCAAPPTNIGTAIDSLTAIIAAANATYKAAHG